MSMDQSRTVSTTSISGIVLASGHSRRMGQNKLLMEFNQKKIYTYILDLLATSPLDEKILVSQNEEILNYGKSLGFKSIYNGSSHEGKSSSIKLGLRSANPTSAYMFFVADQPLLRLETVECLIEKYKENQIITLVGHDEVKSNPVIFPNSYRQSLLSLDKDQGGSKLLKTGQIQKIKVGKNEEFKDIDTKEDYKELIDNYGK